MRSFTQLVKANSPKWSWPGISDQGGGSHIKVIQKRNESSSSLKEENQEFINLKTVNHQNIVKLLEVFYTEEALFIVMEYVSGGDLFTYLEAKGRLTEG